MAISGGERIQPVDDKHARFDVSDIQGDKVATCLWLCAMPGAFSNVSAVVRRIGQVAKIGLGQPAHLRQLLFAADVRFDGVDYQIQGCPACRYRHGLKDEFHLWVGLSEGERPIGDVVLSRRSKISAVPVRGPIARGHRAVGRGQVRQPDWREDWIECPRQAIYAQKDVVRDRPQIPKVHAAFGVIPNQFIRSQVGEYVVALGEKPIALGLIVGVEARPSLGLDGNDLCLRGVGAIEEQGQAPQVPRVSLYRRSDWNKHKATADSQLGKAELYSRLRWVN